MPCDYKKYPPNWKTEIRPRILERAADYCENCGVHNHDIIRRHKTNPAHYISWDDNIRKVFHGYFNGIIIERDYSKPIKIILTISHLDHDPDNWEVKDDRLKALCQRCHLLYDK